MYKLNENASVRRNKHLKDKENEEMSNWVDLKN